MSLAMRWRRWIVFATASTALQAFAGPSGVVPVPVPVPVPAPSSATLPAAMLGPVAIKGSALPTPRLIEENAALAVTASRVEPRSVGERWPNLVWFASLFAMALLILRQRRERS